MQPGESPNPMPPRGRPPLPRGRWQTDGVRPPMPRRVNPAELTPRPPTPHPANPAPAPVTYAEAATPIQPPANVAPSIQPSPQPAAPNVISFTNNSTFQERVGYVPEEPEQKTQKKPRFKIKLTKQLVLPLAVGVAIFAAGSGVYAFLGWQSKQNDPSTILSKALSNNLQLQHVEVNTVKNGETITAKIDLSDSQNPTVFADTEFKMYTSPFKASAYGTISSGYVSYSSVPSDINPQTAKAVQGSWVQVRGKEKPGGLDLRLAKLADPRYHMFSPVLFGNYSDDERARIVKFLLDHKVYKMNSAELKTVDIEGEKVYEVPVELDTGFLKVAMQSAGVSAGYPPQDLQNAVAEIDAYKDGNATLYIAKKSKQIVRFGFNKNGQEASIDYKASETSSLPNEPLSRLTWKSFAPLLWQMKSQAAKKAVATSLDAERKADIDALRVALASYSAQKGSYPTIASMNDASWMNTVIGAHVEQQREPLAASLELQNGPKPGSYAYQPVPASGKGSCNDKNPCMHYKLIATLGNGQQYVVQDP